MVGKCFVEKKVVKTKSGKVAKSGLYIYLDTWKSLEKFVRHKGYLL